MNTSTIELYNAKNNTRVHVITRKDKEYLEKSHIYYCLANYIIPILKENINKSINNEADKIDNNYLIKLGINNNLINEDYELIDSDNNIDICIFDYDKVDDIINELENIYLKITNESLKMLINIDIVETNISEDITDNVTISQPTSIVIDMNNTERVVKTINNKCKYCNKEFKRIGTIPKHESKCKKNIDK